MQVVEVEEVHYLLLHQEQVDREVVEQVDLVMLQEQEQQEQLIQVVAEEVVVKQVAQQEEQAVQE
jgi:hypothetical protein